ncbi:MAG: nucleoside hydrolase [Planktomarina sp.]
MAQKIIIDTDPGQDDAVAILLALASPELEVLGITTVAGNVPLDLTTRNAKMICELAGRPDVPIYEGAAKPMRQHLVTAEHVHGNTGLNGADLPAPSIPSQDMPAGAFILDTLKTHDPGTVTLCTLGPLTNIGEALAKDPDTTARAKGIISMGGAYFEVGNITPTAEFNIFVDPEAAALVASAGMDWTLLPLDVTHKALTSAEWIAGLRAMNTPVGDAVAGLTDFFERFDVEKYGSKGAPLHDPTVIAYLLAPDMFTGRHVNVEIETASPLTRGMTVADWWRVTDRAPNATFIGDVDRDRFFDLLTQRLATYG